MILGASHIVLTSTDLERDKAVLESFGWQTKFIHTAIPTHPGKRAFMSTRSSEQGIVFMQPPDGIAVELIHYSDSLNDSTPSPLQISLPRDFRAGSVECSTCQLRFCDPAPSPSSIFHFVTDLVEAERFWWRGLGFKRANDSEGNGLRLDFDSPIPNWRISLSLIASGAPPTPCLVDAPGFRCLSFLSTDLARDGDRLRASGSIRSTGVMHLLINGNELELELFAGPDGVIVELCKVTRNTRH